MLRRTTFIEGDQEGYVTLRRVFLKKRNKEMDREDYCEKQMSPQRRRGSLEINAGTDKRKLFRNLEWKKGAEEEGGLGRGCHLPCIFAA